MRLNTKQIIEFTGGETVVEPIDASELICGISWDSRSIEAGNLYVALPGERVDGHNFVADALRAGARAVLVQDVLSKDVRLLAREFGAAVIEVSNTAAAITDLARGWRPFLRGRVIAITGSTGKTSTKNLVRDVLSARFSVVATAGNQNNELGVPRTLLNADPETEIIVVEMGMRGLGQLSELCGFVRPDMGIITNVGESHIELLGSRENIARAKAELVAALPSGSGCAVLNAACPYTPFVIEHTCAAERGVELLCFGVEDAVASKNGEAEAATEYKAHVEREAEAATEYKAHVECEAEAEAECEAHVECEAEAATELPALYARARNVRLDEEGRANFTLCIGTANPQGDAAQACEANVARECENSAAQATDTDVAHATEADVVLSVRGIHNVSNALAAACVAARLHMDAETIAAALASSKPEAGRLVVCEARGGFTVIDDAYNANPDSMRASLAVLSAMQVRGRKVAVLGDMGELGSFAPACHEGIGRAAADSHIDTLLCVGELSKLMAAAAREAGMSADCVIECAGVADALEELDCILELGDAVLVKASHFMGLERIVKGLVN